MRTKTMEDVMEDLKRAKEDTETAKTIKALSRELHDFQSALDALIDHVRTGMEP